MRFAQTRGFLDAATSEVPLATRKHFPSLPTHPLISNCCIPGDAAIEFLQTVLTRCDVVIRRVTHHIFIPTGAKAMCKNVQTRHIPSLSEAVIISLGVPILRMCLKSGLLGGALESLEANLAFDALSCLVLLNRNMSEIRFLHFSVMPWRGYSRSSVVRKDPFSHLLRFCRAFALPLLHCPLWFVGRIYGIGGIAGVVVVGVVGGNVSNRYRNWRAGSAIFSTFRWRVISWRARATFDQ
jgi:hypothetical protein